MPDLLKYPLKPYVIHRILFASFFRKIYDSELSNIIKRFVKHRYYLKFYYFIFDSFFSLVFIFLRVFRYFFDFVILLNLLFIVLEISGGSEYAFLSLFFIEILLKIYVFGFKHFLRDSWNM